MRTLVTAVLALALPLLTACGGADDPSSPGGGGGSGPGAEVEEGEALRFVSITVEGETFEAESGPWGPEISFGTRELSVNFDVKLDDEYMGEHVHLEVKGGEIKEGEFELVRHSHAASRLGEGKGAIRFGISTRPGFDECNSESGTLRITHLRDITDGKRYTLTELDGTFEGAFRRRGQQEPTQVKGEFRYRK